MHALIVGLLGETIRSIPQLKEWVRRQAQARLSAAPTTDADGERGRLEAEAKDLADQLNFLAELASAEDFVRTFGRPKGFDVEIGVAHCPSDDDFYDYFGESYMDG